MGSHFWLPGQRQPLNSDLSHPPEGAEAADSWDGGRDATEPRCASMLALANVPVGFTADLRGVEEDITTSSTAISPGFMATGARAGAVADAAALGMSGSLKPGAPGAQWPSSSGNT